MEKARVDFPLPLGPISACTLPGGDLQIDAFEDLVAVDASRQAGNS